MNKTAIKNFAVWARRKLIADATYKAGMIGITEDGIAQPLPQSTNGVQFFDIGTKDYAEVSGAEIKQRKALVDAIKAKEKDSDYKTAFQNVIEEVAYTWFNRLIAVRFMEVNDYLPSGIRVLSSESEGKLEPDFVTTPFDTDLEFTPYEKDVVYQLKDENRLDELFRMLFIKQCNKLHDNLPVLFEGTEDYTELLLTISFTDKDGVIYHLTHDISEDDFNVEKEGQVEIIGWLYQFYISEKHENVVNILKGTVKKEDIPAATALFTTDWVVKYIVDNSLGRYWIERNPGSNLADYMEFFVTPKHGKIATVNEKVNPDEIKFLDPCMGSGHFLVYAFDLFMHIYTEMGWTERDAAKSILENNIYGLDIDDRSAQLAYFALMMKARQYNRRILNLGIIPNITSVKDSPEISENMLAYIGRKTSMKAKLELEKLLEAFKDGKEIGSIAVLPKLDIELIESSVNTILNSDADDLLAITYGNVLENSVLPLIKQAKIMLQKYEIVDTNPPYLNKFDPTLKNFINKNYKDYGSDLFSVFIYKDFFYCAENGYSGFMTPFVWMFIKSYEELRKYIIENKSIASLIQFEYSAFEEATVPICSFVLKNGKETEKGLYFRLSDFKGGMNVQREKVLEALADENCKYFYETTASNFSKIPGSPIAYWVSENFINAFTNGKLLGTMADSKQGLATADNNRFLRLWSEVNNLKIKFDATSFDEAKTSSCKWFPYNKGGDFRRWYGNNDYLVNWENDGFEIKHIFDEKGKLRSRPQNLEFMFKPSASWSLVSSGSAAFRYKPTGHLFDIGGMSFFSKENLMYLLALSNTKITYEILKILAPTINFQCGDIAGIPVYVCTEKRSNIEEMTLDNITLSKTDWDSYETSWDFTRHPLIAVIPKYGSMFEIGNIHLDECYECWKNECNERFAQLKANEEELNRIFIDIYGLQDELTPEVEDKDVTVHFVADTKEDAPESMRNSNYLRTKQDEIKSLISYAVGCMFGRYSPEKSGLVYAGGEWDSSKYPVVPADEDNCIIISDDEYFNDDIVSRLCDFIETIYGKDSLEHNLQFIADALGNKGVTSREVIRNYFLSDFFTDHCQTYSVTGSGKRPIYWLFDSGKNNGFKALVYMHRWNADTVGNVRVEYLHKIQKAYENEINRMQDTIDNSGDNRQISQAIKRKEKLMKQLKETQDYDERIAHIALSRIDIDLDDGVKYNYRKVQTDTTGKYCDILADSKNIMMKEDDFKKFKKG